MTETFDQRFARYLDEGWTGAGPRPSLLFRIGEAVLATAPSGITGALSPKAPQQAADFRRWAIATARQRYREGFYADPFTNEPRRRPA